MIKATSISVSWSPTRTNMKNIQRLRQHQIPQPRQDMRSITTGTKSSTKNSIKMIKKDQDTHIQTSIKNTCRKRRKKNSYECSIMPFLMVKSLYSVVGFSS